METRKEKIARLRKQVIELHKGWKEQGKNLREIDRIHAELSKELQADLDEKGNGKHGK